MYSWRTFIEGSGTCLADNVNCSLSFKLSKILTARELLTHLNPPNPQKTMSSHLFTFPFLVRIEFMSVESDETRYPPSKVMLPKIVAAGAVGFTFP